MDDPKISSYPKPLTLKEKSNLVPMKLDDFDYVLAFKIQLFDKTSLLERSIGEIPPSLGSLKASILEISNFRES